MKKIMIALFLMTLNFNAQAFDVSELCPTFSSLEGVALSPTYLCKTEKSSVDGSTDTVQSGACISKDSDGYFIGMTDFEVYETNGEDPRTGSSEHGFYPKGDDDIGFGETAGYEESDTELSLVSTKLGVDTISLKLNKEKMTASITSTDRDLGLSSLEMTCEEISQ